MTKRLRIEDQIEKSRNLGNWESLREEGRLLSERVGNKDGAVILLQCECDFERQLQKSKAPSYDIISTLEQIPFSRDSKFNVQLESKLLLGRIFFHQKKYQNTLDILETINITPERPQTPYLARLTAQACTAKAISTQKSPTNSFMNLEAAAQTNKLIELFTKAADETMHFFKLYSEFLKSNPAISSHTLPISPTIESIFKKLPRLYTDNKAAISCYRKYLIQLDARFAPHVKAQLARDCAMLILHSANTNNYTKLQTPKSKKDTFVPETIEQEVFLLLLISDTLHEYVIDRAPEHDEARKESLGHATSIIDMISLCLSRVSQYTLIAQRIEKTLKYAYQHYHLNFQFALSLIQCGHFTRAYFVLDECIEIEPDNMMPYMTGAKVSIFNLKNYSKGLEYLNKHECVKKHPRYHEYLAECYSLQSVNSRSMAEKRNLNMKALENFRLVSRPTFYTHYRYGLELARNNKIDSAITQCKSSLKLNPDFGNSFLLLQLLLTTQLKFTSALEGARFGVSKWPGLVGFQILVCNLLIHFKDYDEVIRICKLWIVHYAAEKSKELSELNGSEFSDVLSEYTHYTQKTHGTEIISSSGNHESIFLAESNLTEIESIISNDRSEKVFSSKSNLLINSWCYVAQIFIKIGKIAEANKCIDEIRAIGKGNQSKILFISGLISEHEGDFESAMKMFVQSLSINSENCDVLIQLAKLYIRLGQFTQAEKCIRDAIGINPSCSEFWFELGIVLEGLGEDSSSCFLKAAELNHYRPILDYDIISIHS